MVVFKTESIIKIANQDSLNSFINYFKIEGNAYFADVESVQNVLEADSKKWVMDTKFLIDGTYEIHIRELS